MGTIDPGHGLFFEGFRLDRFGLARLGAGQSGRKRYRGSSILKSRGASCFRQASEIG